VKRGKKPAGWISEQLCVQAAATCNLYCACCQNPPGGKMPPLSRTLAVIKKKGITSVSLEGGGEPTINPAFFRLIGRLRTAGVRSFMLSTNAVALADAALCEKAVREIDFFTVNFPSHLPGVYARATRSVKFRLALKGLMNLKACGAEEKLRLFHIVSAFNYKALPGFAVWAAQQLPRAALVNLTFVRNSGRVGDSREIVPSYSEASPYIKLALARLKLAGMKAVVQNVPLCQLKDFEGFSFEFQRWKRGDRVLEEGVAERADYPACRSCALAPACCGARTDYARVRGLEELKASRKAPVGIKPERF
jgi:pyruvate-formate lyase-activating enzyme